MTNEKNLYNIFHCCRFNTVNIAKVSETVPLGTDIPEEELYARPCRSMVPRGWLVDLINRFVLHIYNKFTPT